MDVLLKEPILVKGEADAVLGVLLYSSTNLGKSKCICKRYDCV
ncbi:MAG: hypothetical protein QXK54_07420 [Ignisphaera sp.]